MGGDPAHAKVGQTSPDGEDDPHQRPEAALGAHLVGVEDVVEDNDDLREEVCHDGSRSCEAC